jgi:hypothetical protein
VLDLWHAQLAELSFEVATEALNALAADGTSTPRRSAWCCTAPGC